MVTFYLTLERNIIISHDYFQGSTYQYTEARLEKKCDKDWSGRHKTPGIEYMIYEHNFKKYILKY